MLRAGFELSHFALGIKLTARVGHYLPSVVQILDNLAEGLLRGGCYCEFLLGVPDDLSELPIKTIAPLHLFFHKGLSTDDFFRLGEHTPLLDKLRGLEVTKSDHATFLFHLRVDFHSCKGAAHLLTLHELVKHDLVKAGGLTIRSCPLL